MEHACSSCAYFYMTKCLDSKIVFNSLTDMYDNIRVSTMKPCCGYRPEGDLLDPERPICVNYRRKK